MLDLFADAEPWQEPLAPGAVILRRFALSRATALLAGIDEVTAVSPFRHMVTPGGYTIRDLGSQNGTYVNGTRVDEAPLADGDRITIGEINLVFRGAAAAMSA